jgi:hypothetical protein
VETLSSYVEKIRKGGPLEENSVSIYVFKLSLNTFLSCFVQTFSQIIKYIFGGLLMKSKKYRTGLLAALFVVQVY